LTPYHGTERISRFAKWQTKEIDHDEDQGSRRRLHLQVDRLQLQSLHLQALQLLNRKGRANHARPFLSRAPLHPTVGAARAIGYDGRQVAYWFAAAGEQ